MSVPSIKIFSDGACSGNPGPGGWGCIIELPTGMVTELGASDFSTTNNRMELTAALRAFEFIEEQKNDVHFYTDSTYLIRGITQWIWGWKKRQWKTAEGAEVLNRDLWEKLDRVIQKRKIHWHYVRGHVGIAGNERCDEIAVAFSQKKNIHLYHGFSDNYSYNLNHLPEDTSLPEMKARGEKKQVYSYLSLLGGAVIRHQNWGSCERRVKGQSGAKFKKAMSRQEELDILKSWGVSSSNVKDD